MTEPDTAAPEYLDREAAAAWFAARGIGRITADALRQMAARGKGPRFYKLGRYPYYRAEDLDEWLRAEMGVSDRGRAPPRTLRGRASEAA
jgi:hypothetical protein